MNCMLHSNTAGCEINQGHVFNTSGIKVVHLWTASYYSNINHTEPSSQSVYTLPTASQHSFDDTSKTISKSMPKRQDEGGGGKAEESW